jgi:hypothetical protein
LRLRGKRRLFMFQVTAQMRSWPSLMLSVATPPAPLPPPPLTMEDALVDAGLTRTRGGAPAAS